MESPSKYACCPTLTEMLIDSSMADVGEKTNHHYMAEVNLDFYFDNHSYTLETIQSINFSHWGVRWPGRELRAEDYYDPMDADSGLSEEYWESLRRTDALLDTNEFIVLG